MRHFAICPIVFLASSHLNAQGTWRVSDSTFNFSVAIDTVLYAAGPGYFLQVSGIDIERNGELLQHIRPPESCTFEEFLDREQVFVLEDVDFDGLKDIRLLSWHSVEYYTTYWYWTLDGRSGPFVRDTSLDNVQNPMFDHENKVVHSWWRLGLDLFANEEYGYDATGRLQLMWSEMIGEDAERGDALLVRAVRENGILVEEEIRLPLEEMARYSERRRRP